MADLSWIQYALIALTFVWSGVVRSALGFGGAVLSLPFLLLIDDQPLIFLPIIAVHLLIFSALTVYQNNRQVISGNAQSTVAWAFLGKAMLVMLVPKIAGVLGLITLPNEVLSTIIFVIICFYSVSYLFNRPFVSKSRTADILFLMLGGYISGTSLIGAPVVLAVFAKYVDRHQLRDTLFVLWFVMVAIKLASFVYADIDLQLVHHLWLLPCAALGHVIGLRVHDYLLTGSSVLFYRVIGGVLLVASTIGLVKTWW